MKITFIISSLEAGGAERVLATLANALCKENEVSIIKFDQEKPFYPLNQKIQVKNLPPFKYHNLYHKILSRFKKFFALRKSLKECRADVFISFLDTTNIICILAKQGLKTPLIICEHSVHTYLKHKIWRIFRRIVYPFCDALTVLTKEDQNFYQSFVKKVVLLENPCHFKPKEGMTKENVVLFVGRLDANKNAKLFLKAIALLEQSLREQTRFLIVGEGGLKQDLIFQAKALGIRVEFLGRCEDMQSLYEKAKVLCLCSFIEGLPTVLIEALYFEVCRISTSYINGSQDLINDGFDGFLVGLDDEKAMALNLSRVLKDENLRKKLVLNAKRRCENFDVDFIVSKWQTLFKELKDA